MIEDIDLSTMQTRLAYTGLLLVWSVHRVYLFRRSELGARFRLDRKERETAAEHTRKLPRLYVLWGVGTLLEVWFMPAKLAPLVMLVGIVLVAAAFTIRARQMRADDRAWTLRSFARELPRDIFPARLELIGLAMLHGAVLGAALGWIIATGYKRRLQRVLGENDASS